MMQIAKGQNEQNVRTEVEALLQDGWKLNDKGELEKTYHFKTYTKVLVGARDLSIIPKLMCLGLTSHYRD